MPYTELDKDMIGELVRQFNIEEVISFNLLSGGSENTNYRIASEAGTFVLTICEQKSLKETLHLCLLLEHLADNGFSTSTIIRNKDKEAVIFYKDKPVILKSYLEGTIVQDLSPDLMEQIGVQMGQLHRISAPEYLPKKLGYGIEYFGQVAHYAANFSFHQWLLRIEEQMRPYLTDTLPKCLIHSDIFYSNVIVQKDECKVYIMDFEEAAYYYRIFDVGMAIIGLCKEGQQINLEKVYHLLSGYVQEISLTQEEQKALQPCTVYAAAAMSFWRHRNFNYTNPTPGMEDHYLELKNVADFVNDLPQDTFLDILRGLA